MEKAQAFIQSLKKINPSFEYHQGQSRSGKPGFVGIYYSIREEQNNSK